MIQSLIIHSHAGLSAEALPPSVDKIESQGCRNKAAAKSGTS